MKEEVRIMGENYYGGGYGGGASCTEVQARGVFVTRDVFASSSLRSSLGLTFPSRKAVALFFRCRRAVLICTFPPRRECCQP